MLNRSELLQRAVVTVPTAGSSPERNAIASRPKPPSNRLVVILVVAVGLGFVVLVAVAFGIRAFVAEAYEVRGLSMAPTLVEGERVLVRKDDVGPFERGAIIVYRSPEGGTDLIHRVIGLPFETVTLEGERVTIDGALLELDSIRPGVVRESLGPYHTEVHTFDQAGDEFPVDNRLVTHRLTASQYLVLGDNRGRALDSRYFGPIESGSVIGRVTRVYWPAAAARTLH